MLAGALFASGVLSVARRSKMATNYRSDVGAQEPRKIIFLDGVSIAYTDTGGNDPVLLCLHAIGHGARDFENLSRRLDQQYRVIALDFPGQGNSGSDGQPASGSRYTRLVSQFIEQLNLNSITLLGNSIGGAVSVRYASLHPERVKALVLCDSGGLGAPGAVGGVFIKTFVQFFAAGRRGASWFPWAFDKYYRRVLRTQSAQQERHRIIRSAYEIAPVLEQAWRSFERPEENLGPILPQIRCPVLLAWAKDDFVIPLKLSAPALERFPNHRLEVFTGGHAAFLEDPDRFEQVLRRFLADVNTAPVRDSAESEEKGR
jgi:4,5:9,10-diseco-3-hydroxy-5,9,17-trioxoandrosta-1(10),2-diene-4-oate hydrolase